METGIYYGLSNDDYHNGPGISKSQLDHIAKSPAHYLFMKNAPVDTEKLKALDMGTALHCLLLEPDEFHNRFIEAPEFNRRTNQGKEDEKEFLKSCESTGKIVMDHEQHRKLKLMRDSAFAHHGARYFLEAEGVSEASIYWTDSDTDELCRIRPDKMISNQPVIIDVKKVADMSRFDRHIEEFRYHVQNAMYQEGYLRHYGEMPVFLFLAVSETVDCGRYPVHVYELDQDDIDVGFRLFKQNLHTFHECRISDDWGGIEPISRPAWARRISND